MSFTAEQPPCPDWCANSDAHLADLMRIGAQFTHRSVVSTVRTTDVDHNCNPIGIDVALVRVDHTDPERGWWADPTNVEVGGYTFDTQPLAQLIRLLIADLMTIAGKDMIRPGFTVDDSGP